MQIKVMEIFLLYSGVTDVPLMLVVFVANIDVTLLQYVAIFAHVEQSLSVLVSFTRTCQAGF